MANVNIEFSRMLLAELRATLTRQQVRELQGSYTYGYQRGAGEWEWQTKDSDGAKSHYWFGHADNAFDARYKGIESWLRKHYPSDEDNCNTGPDDTAHRF